MFVSDCKRGLYLWSDIGIMEKGAFYSKNQKKKWLPYFLVAGECIGSPTEVLITRFLIYTNMSGNIVNV